MNFPAWAGIIRAGDTISFLGDLVKCYFAVRGRWKSVKYAGRLSIGCW